MSAINMNGKVMPGDAVRQIAGFASGRVACTAAGASMSDGAQGRDRPQHQG